MDLDTAQKECRNASSELFRVKSAYEESVLQLDDVRKENKVLSNEIKDIMDQISEGGRSIHEIDKMRELLSKKRTRFSELNLNSLKLDKKLSVVWLKRKKSLQALARTLLRLPIPCK